MFLIALGIIAILLYFYGTRNFKYWEKRGVKHVKPIPFFGTSLPHFLHQISISEHLVNFYNEYPEDKFVGFFMGNQARILLRDPEIIKHILTTDFEYFHARGVNIHKYVYEPMMRNLFTVDGDIWKLMRQRLTPAFTSGKLKAMFPLIIERTEKLKKLAATAAKTGKEVNVRDLMARYTTDFIGACGFGLDIDTLNDKNTTFRELGRRIFTVTKRDALIVMLKVIGTETFKHLNFFAPEIEKNTVGLVKAIMSQRNYKHSGRNDFIDLLLDLKAKGKLIGESVEKKNDDGTSQIVQFEMDDELLAAQVFIFFAAGFETSSSATSYTFHQLAFHPEEQKKCQDEIDQVLSRHGGKLSYEAVKEMKYLEMAFRESLRMYPPLGFLTRCCAKKYTIPGTDVTIGEDVAIAIPIQALQNDEKYFPEPEKFKPERFHPDNANVMSKHVYLPFGEGPRACIGERLGLTVSLAGMAAVLSHFSVIPSESSLRYPITDPSSMIVQTIKGGIPLALSARRINVNGP